MYGRCVVWGVGLGVRGAVRTRCNHPASDNLPISPISHDTPADKTTLGAKKDKKVFPAGKVGAGSGFWFGRIDGVRI